MTCSSLNGREPSTKWQIPLLEWAAAARIVEVEGSVSRLPCVYFRAGRVGMEIARAPLGKGPVLQEAGHTDM